MTGIMDTWGKYKAVGRTVLEADKKPEVSPEAITAAGQSCLALAQAIASLTQKDMFDEARELHFQLRMTCRSIRWLIHENRATTPEGFTKIDTKGITLDKDAEVCKFICGFLSDGERKAMDVIRKALGNGYDKNEVFKAKEVLGLQSKEKRGNKWWSLPNDTA